MRYYPQISYRTATHEFPMARGFALLAYAMSSDAWSNRALNGISYIGQELDRLTPDP